MTEKLPDGLTIRLAKTEDHPRIISVMPDWWSSRDLTHMVPRVFLVHFCNTSFIIEKDSELVAFLIGFLSPALPEDGYIHFCGVHPDYRSLGIGSHIYGRFEQLCRENNRRYIRACTSRDNRASIEYHRHIGFELESGDDVIDGIPVIQNYNKPGDSKVRFLKTL